MAGVADPTEDEIERIRGLVHGDGEKWTNVRRLVAMALLASREHLTAEEIAFRVRRRDATCSLTAVYRTLAIYLGLGIVRRIGMDQGPALYEMAMGRRSHHHLVDVVHQTVLEVECPELDDLLQRLARRYGRELAAASIDIYVHPPASRRAFG